MRSLLLTLGSAWLLVAGACAYVAVAEPFQFHFDSPPAVVSRQKPPRRIGPTCLQAPDRGGCVTLTAGG